MMMTVIKNDENVAEWIDFASLGQLQDRSCQVNVSHDKLRQFILLQESSFQIISGHRKLVEVKI
jgi:hypothetical protein